MTEDNDDVDDDVDDKMHNRVSRAFKI